MARKSMSPRPSSGDVGGGAGKKGGNKPRGSRNASQRPSDIDLGGDVGKKGKKGAGLKGAAKKVMAGNAMGAGEPKPGGKKHGKDGHPHHKQGLKEAGAPEVRNTRWHH